MSRGLLISTPVSRVRSLLEDRMSVSTRRFVKRTLARAHLMVTVGRGCAVDNIYHLSVQKAGSQWIKEVFNDRRVRRYSGLVTYPQHAYEMGEFRERFPRRTYVPGLYMSYELYGKIRKPKTYRTFAVIRDPRDVVVSWYHSALETHRLMGRIGVHREALKSMSQEEGLHYSMEYLAPKFAEMRTWAFNAVDPALRVLKFEDLIETPFSQFQGLFEHCGIPLPDAVLRDVLDDYTKTKLRERDMKRRLAKSESHYRKESSSHRAAFTPGHHDHFREIAGNLVEYLGYAP